MDKSSDKLQIEIAKQVLKNPILLASGTAGFGYDIADVLDISQLGGIVTKTITLEPRDGNPPPRIWETPSGMLNSIGLANPGLEVFIKDIVPLLADLPTEIIVSVGGNSEEEFIELVEKISEIEFVNTIELNLSCPNVKEGGIHFGR
ncbi:dihydroorotate dehydrogenase, partial [bacterium]